MPPKGKPSDKSLQPLDKKLKVPAVKNFGIGDLDNILRPRKPNALPPSKVLTRPAFLQKRSSLQSISSNQGGYTSSDSVRQKTHVRNGSSNKGNTLEPIKTGHGDQAAETYDVAYNDIPAIGRRQTNLGQAAGRSLQQRFPPKKGKERVFIEGRSDTKTGAAPFALTELPPTPVRKKTPLPSLQVEDTLGKNQDAEGNPKPRNARSPNVEAAGSKTRSNTGQKDKVKPIEKKAVLPNLNSYERVITGFLDGLPQQRSSVVRIFLSSTFSDFKVERNALTKLAYPELKSYCADIGLDFQVVDLRWGISEESSNDHTVEDICLEQIEQCHRISRGPNFVAMTGSRYGFRPLPPQIPSEEFALLRNLSDELQLDNRTLLDEWYLKDENAIPCTHFLQPINSKYQHFTDMTYGNADKRREAINAWHTTALTLQNILRKCVTEAHINGSSSDEIKHKYFWSVTEQEITKGLLQAKDPNASAFYIKRTFTSTDELLHSELGPRFIDTTKDPESERLQVDEETAGLIGNLCKNKISKILGLANRHSFATEWTDTGIDPENVQEHEHYIKKLAASFTETTKHLVEVFHEQEEKEKFEEISVAFHLTADNNVKQKTKPKENANDNDLFMGYMAMQNMIAEHQKHDAPSDRCSKRDASRIALRTEILHHLHFCKNKSNVFCGRDLEIEEVKNMLLRSSKGSSVVLHAKSGYGKTAFLAAIAKETKSWLPNCVTVVRFLGTSPKSTNIKQVLASVCEQICIAYGQQLDPNRLTRMNKLRKYFSDLITYISMKFGSSRPLFIILDSIDQLSSSEQAHKCTWIPHAVPENVFLLLSTIPDIHNCLPNLLQLDGDEKELAFYELNIFPKDIVSIYAKTYMEAKSVCLRDHQLAFLLGKLSANTEPLYMKLLLDSAIKWHSYSDISNVQLANTTKEAISEMFLQLEKKYSPVFIEACLSYLTLGLNGLSEIELEDVLSMDDEVLQEVYKYHNPPVDGIVRIPPLMWARVHHDLREYIVERQTHGKTTLNWYHRQFIEAATKKYTEGDKFKIRHSRLAELYLVEAQFTRTINLPQRKLIVENADRQITLQANSPKNTRKLTSLPYHLKLAGNNEKLKDSAFCNMNFIKSFISSFSVTEMIQEMTSSSDGDIEAVRDSLRYISVQVQKDESTLAAQILGQLGDKREGNPVIKQLCKQATETLVCSTNHNLVPLTGGIAPSTNLLKWYLNGVSDIVCMSEDGISLLLLSDNAKNTTSFKILNTETMQSKSIYSKVRLAPKHCVFSKSGQRLYMLCKKTFYVVNVKSGEVIISQNTDTNHKVELSECIAVSSCDGYVALAGKDRMALLEDRSEENAAFRARSAMDLSGVIGTSNLVFATNTEHTVSTHSIKGPKRTIGCIALWDYWGKALKTRVPLPAPVESGFLYQQTSVNGHDLFICGCENAQILVINVHLGEIVADLFKELSINAPVLSTYQKQSNYLVTCIKGQQEVKVWNVSGGSVSDIATFDTRSPVTTVAVSSDSNTVITADEVGMVKLFDIFSKKTKNSVRTHNGTLSNLLCTDKDMVFTCASDKVLKQWDLDELLTKPEEDPGKHGITSNENDINCHQVKVAVTSPDGKWITTGSTIGVCLWKCTDSGLTLEKVLLKESCSGIYFTDDSSSVYALAQKSQSLHCWLLPSGESSSVANIVKDDKFHAACLTQGGKRLVLTKIGSPDVLHIVDTQEKESIQSCKLEKLCNFTPCCLYTDSITTYAIGYTEIRTSEVLPAHNLVTVTISNGASQTCKQNDKGVGRSGLKDLQAFTVWPGAPGEGVLVGTYGAVLLWTPTQETPVEMKSAGSGSWPEKPLQHYLKHQFKVSINDVLDLPFTHICTNADDSIVMTGSRSGALLGWVKSKDPTAKEASVVCMKGHTNAITSASFSADSKFLVSGSQDRTLRVWEVASGKQLCKMYLHMTASDVFFIKGSKFVGAVAADMDRNKYLLFQFSHKL